MTFFALGGTPSTIHSKFPPRVIGELFGDKTYLYTLSLILETPRAEVFSCFRAPRILQRHDAVKRKPPILRASGVRDKVPMPEKLQSVSRFLP